MTSDLVWNPSSLLWVSVVCINIDLAWNSSSLLKVPVVCMSSHWNPSSLFWVPWRGTQALYWECLWVVWTVIGVEPKLPIVSACGLYKQSLNPSSLLRMPAVRLGPLRPGRLQCDKSSSFTVELQGTCGLIRFIYADNNRELWLLTLSRRTGGSNPGRGDDLLPGFIL